MNKEEIQKRVRLLRQEIETINTMISNFETQLDAEKPKLRHGDFGMWGNGRDWFVVDDSKDDKIYIHLLWKEGGCKRNQWRRDDNILDKTIIIGNIFDLMNGWSEPFEEFDKYGIRLDHSSVADIFITAPDAHLTIPEAEEFYREFGHLIVARKRAMEK